MELKARDPIPQTYLSRDRLRELLRYDPLTGVFYWRVATRGHRVGAEAGSFGHGYRLIMIGKRNWRAHRLAWLYVHGVFPEGDIDHVNGDKSDNRIANLRAANRTQNNGNSKRPKTNTSGFKGVSRKDGKWRASINFKRRQIHLGVFDSPSEAHAAYAHAASRLFGEFARAA